MQTGEKPHSENQHNKKPRCDKWKGKSEDMPKYKFKHKTQKQMFALMDAHWEKKAKKEAAKASKEFAALSITPSLDSLSSDSK